MDPQQQDEPAMAAARTLGTTAGEAAASGYSISDEPTARKVLAGIEDGDPQVLDTFPWPDLSGQWADVPSGPQVVREILDDADVQHASAGDNHAPGACNRCDWYDASGDLLDAYELAYGQAMQDEIERMARYQVTP